MSHPKSWITFKDSKPRSTADFINDVWMCRISPVYALRPKEIDILTSRTLKGWLWRMALRLLRYDRPKTPNETETETLSSTWPSALTDALTRSESERTMEHYLAVTRKFTPETLPPKQQVDPNSCDSTEFHQSTEVKPKKRVRKSRVKKHK